MNIDGVSNGIVLDHISAGKGMMVYDYLKLSKLHCQVALIQNCQSRKMGRKDILKIDELIDLDLDVLGYLDPGITVNTVKEGAIIEKRKLRLPRELHGVIRCKNPRCISSVEQELPQRFRLADEEKGVYRCIYCDHKAQRE